MRVKATGSCPEEKSDNYPHQNKIKRPNKLWDLLWACPVNAGSNGSEHEAF